MAVAVASGVTVRVGLADGVGVEESVAVKVRVAVAVGVAVATGTSVSVGTRVAVAVAVGLRGVAVAVAAAPISFRPQPLPSHSSHNDNSHLFTFDTNAPATPAGMWSQATKPQSPILPVDFEEPLRTPAYANRCLRWPQHRRRRRVATWVFDNRTRSLNDAADSSAGVGTYEGPHRAPAGEGCPQPVVPTVPKRVSMDKRRPEGSEATTACRPT